MKVPAPPLQENFDSLEAFQVAKADWSENFNKMVASYKDEIEALFNMDCSDWPYKSMRQLLAENPNHAGGLAQLAQAEEQAERRRVQEQRFLLKANRLPD